MPSTTIRDVSHETDHALRVRAAMNGRSADAELRMILEEAVRLGSLAYVRNWPFSESCATSRANVELESDTK